MKLQLSLKTKWFELTKAGIKTEDYREITPYWCSRLMLYQGNKQPQVFYHRMLKRWDLSFIKKLTEVEISNRHDTFQKFTQNRITLGYPSSSDTDRIIEFEHDGIEIRTGNPDWGAESNKLYFVVKHGKLIT
jgi:hypothetical protein